jgi:hypothetical protein
MWWLRPSINQNQERLNDLSSPNNELEAERAQK